MKKVLSTITTVYRVRSIAVVAAVLFFSLHAFAQQPTRPQEPKPPFPYRSVEVAYENPSAPGVTLAATLTVPDGNKQYPAVIMVGGSGQFPRDQPFYGHKIPWVLADYLTRSGIAVLRFDDRGAGKSTLGSKKMSELIMSDFVSDVRAGIAFLRTRSEIDTHRIGLIGHSEGTGVASIIAAESPSDVAFICLLAAAASSMTKGEIVATQSAAMARAQGFSANIQRADSAFVRRAIQLIPQKPVREQRLEQIGAIADSILATLPTNERAMIEKGVRARVNILSSENFYRDAIELRRDYLREVQCPVLALNGSKDVLISAEDTAPRLLQSLKQGKCKDYTVTIMPNLNHLFQTATTGLMEEANTIEETISPSMLTLIRDWIVRHI